MSNLRSKITKIFLYSIIIGIFAIILNVLINNSRLSIHVMNKESGNVVVTIFDKSSKPTKKIDFSTSDKTINVRRGRHYIEIRQGQKSYVTSVSTSWFINKTSINITLKDEQGREFVGDKPNECMSYDGNTLLSADCGKELSIAKTHISANNTTPTMALTDNTLNGTLEGFVSLKNIKYALVKETSGVESYSYHSLYKVSSDGKNPFELFDPISLEAVGNETYAIREYKSGYILYTDSLSDIKYYEYNSTKPQKMSIPTAKDKKLKPYSVNISDTNIYVIYSNIDQLEKLGSNKLKSEIVSFDGKTHITLSGAFSEVLDCGAERICARTGERIDIMNKINKKVVGSIYDTSNMISPTINGLILATRKGVLKFDTKALAGNYTYTFGDYSYVSSTYTSNILLLNIRAKDKNYALALNDLENDSIDKKYYELINNPSLKASSLYKNLLFISPETGELVYDTNEGFFNYNKAIVDESYKSINETIKKINIDTTKYKIVRSIE